MKNPPTIESARLAAPAVLELAWSTGETLRVDLADLPKRNRAFAALAKPDVFARFEIADWGHGLDWPGDLGMGADRLYELARRQAGLPTASEFDAWMQSNGLSLAGAAEALGMTRRMIAHYRTGSRPIPKVVGLALRGFERGTHA